MRTLVTGANGFIGSHLVKRLLLDGHFVVALDRFRQGKKNYADSMRNHPKLTLVKADLAIKREIRGAYFKDIDWVFHLGAVSKTEESFERPVYYHQVNVSGTFYVLMAAREAQIKRFIYAASASCYGVQNYWPTPEEAEIKLDSIYAASKYLGEHLVLHFGKVYKMPVISLRMVRVYGPKLIKGGSYGSILTKFMRQKEAGQEFTVVGDGRQRRDLVYVEDAVEAFMLAAKSKITNEVSNIGGENTYSILEIVRLLGGKITYLPKRPWEGSFKQVDTSKIKRLLGWKPKVDLKEGIGRILQG